MRFQPLHLLILLLVAFALPLGACGKKGKPQPPGKAQAEAPAESGEEAKKEETE